MSAEKETEHAARPRREHLITFAVGALGYGALELLWRGHTHWTMLLCGGLAHLLLRAVSALALPLAVQALVGTAGITALELAVGLVVNRGLHWNVWDYSDRWGNLWGQICPLYSVLWYGLCAAVLAALRQGTTE